jgi:two-component sensor histidine kinase
MNGKSLGLRIMNSLAAQLGGELTWIEQNKGTVVRLAFPRVSSIVSITDKPK